MRLILLTLVFCLGTIISEAQIDNLSGHLQDVPKRVFNIGIAIKKGQSSMASYTKTGDSLTYSFARKPTVALSAYWQPFKRNRSFLFGLEASSRSEHYANRFNPPPTSLRPNYHEIYDYGWFQFSPVIQIIPLAKSRFSPIVGGKLNFIFPTKFEYNFFLDDRGFLDWPASLTIKNGLKPDIGWEGMIGLRGTFFEQRCIITLALFHLRHTAHADLPGINIFIASDPIITFKNQGVSLEFHYSL